MPGDSGELWPQEARPGWPHGAFPDPGGAGQGEMPISPGPCPSLPTPGPARPVLTLLVSCWHRSPARARFCPGRAASALRDQSWLSPSLREWIWCQGQGKAAAAAPEHHPPTCSLGKVLQPQVRLRPFTLRVPRAETPNSSLSPEAAPARAALTPSTSEVSFVQVTSDSLKIPK